MVALYELRHEKLQMLEGASFFRDTTKNNGLLGCW
jgi:hypothetical protein